MNESRGRDPERHLLDQCRPEPTHLGDRGRAFGSPTSFPHPARPCLIVFSPSPSSLVLKSRREPSPAPSARRLSSSQNPSTNPTPQPLPFRLRSTRERLSWGGARGAVRLRSVGRPRHLLSGPRVAMATRACWREPGRATRGSFLVGVTQPSV